MGTNRIGHWFLIEALGLLGGEEVQTSVKFVKLPSPHPGSFLKAPMPLPMGEGGRSDGGREGRVRGPWPIERHSSAIRGCSLLLV